MFVCFCGGVVGIVGGLFFLNAVAVGVVAVGVVAVGVVAVGVVAVGVVAVDVTGGTVFVTICAHGFQWGIGVSGGGVGVGVGR